MLFFKVFFSENRSIVFKTLIVHCKTFDGKLLYNLSSPFTKLHRTFGIYLVTNRNNCRKIVVLCIVVFAILGDRKSTRLNSSHVRISYAVFCLKKKKKKILK